MKAVSSWSFRPYAEPHNLSRARNPYICRLVPGEHSFMAEFFDNGAPDAAHRLHWRVRGEGEYQSADINGDTAQADSLAADTDYELYISRADDPEARSEIRLIHTGTVPGAVVNYLHPEDPAYAFSGRFLASPSLVRLPSGRLVSSMDVHASGGGENLTILFYSEDDGTSWLYLTEIYPCFWGKLFLDGGKLYLMGMSRCNGDLLIGRSDNDGLDWGMPTVLLRSTCVYYQMGLHRGPMPILRHNGRLMTDIQYGSWDRKLFTDAVLSAPEGADLLDCKVWSLTDFWNPQQHPEIPALSNGGIEGNLVAAPNGKVYDILRFGRKKPLVLEYDPSEPEGKLKNAPVIDMPISDSKADILRDQVSGRYYMLCSYALDEPKTNRNLLAMMMSDDLFHWELNRFVLDYRYLNPMEVGFQYIDFIFDGDDILFICRTAFNHANNFHDSNYQTFHKVENFRA